MFIATIAGNLGKDAVIRNAGSSEACGFSVAATSGYGEREQTNWVNCSIWGKRGAALSQYLVKGTPVTCIGEITTREHEGKTYLEMNVTEIKLQGRAAGGDGSRNASQSQPASKPADDGGFGSFDGDDVPF